MEAGSRKEAASFYFLHQREIAIEEKRRIPLEQWEVV
jgi:hypothetical protein